VKEVVRDTIIINNETNQYESARVAKLDKYKISTSHYPAFGQDERVRYLVLHYTALDNEKSLKVLTKQEVSAHYLVPNDYTDSIYVLVDETKRAWHAGLSYWKGVNNINFSSIGIEIVNLGYTTDKTLTGNPDLADAERYFYDFPHFQIDKVAVLAKDIIERYNINPVNVLAHSDVAPQRKHDPGPKFPWKRLYKEFGIGAWYEEVHYNLYYSKFPFSETDSTSFILSVQDDLNKYGYEIQKTGIWDKQTQKVITAFQYHFRPEKYDGIMDAETWAILQALILKYRN
jgi:N-acetylmuramoyl-L-alanine amidase